MVVTAGRHNRPDQEHAMTGVTGKKNHEIGSKQRVEGIVYRAAETDNAIIDKDERTLRVSFSSDTPYLRSSFWEEPWIEVLGHAEDEIDLARMNNGATVHYNHSRTREDRLGGVLSAETDGHRATAEIKLSQRKSIDDIWNDVEAKLIRNTSVGYKIHEKVLMKKNDDGPDEYRVTRWEPVELSLVDIPADPTVGVGRGDGVEHCYRVIDLELEPATTGRENEDTIVSKKTGQQPAGDDVTTGNEDDTITKTVAEELADKAAKKAAKTAKSEALAGEAERQQEIREAFDGHAASDGAQAILTKCLADQDCTVDQARTLLLEDIGKNKTPSAVGHFQPGEDAADKFRDMCLNTLEHKAGFKTAEGVRIALDGANTVRGLGLVELARACLTFHNLDAHGEPYDMVGRALNMRAGSAIGHTPSDFPNILLNVASKAVLLGFEEIPETWIRWCRVGNLSDFKQATRVGLSQFEDLEIVGPGGEYKFGTMSDKGETIQLAKFGKIFPIARETIINDDLSMLLRIPTLMGRAAARVPGDLAYIALTSNPLLADGVALFDAAHNNLGTGGTISVTTVGEARELMALQSDIGNSANGSNILLGFLLVPVQLEDVANVLRNSEFDPDSATQSRAPNPRRGTFEVVGEARLSADSVTQWYATAGAGFDTVEVAFLDGMQEPRIEEKAGWTVDGAEFKVAMEVAAAPMEHRTFVRNAGS